MVLQVTNSPFGQDQVELLNRLLPTLTEGQRIWLSGYLSALQGQGAGMPAAAAAAGQTAVPAASAPAVPQEATVLFGSQTGNAQKLAKKFAAKLEDRGVQVTLSSMGDFKPNTLKKVRQLFILVSTQGEGDPPDNAISFYEFLHSKRAPQLDGMPFSVLALGDTSYEFFCKIGKDFDERLKALGGKRLAPRVDCDVDFEDAAGEWMASVLSALAESAGASAPAGASAAGDAAISAGAESEYSRSRPFQAAVLENLNLNGRGSDRETRHVELSLEGSNLRYEPGDSLGVYPSNHPRLVEELIAELGLKADEPVSLPKSGESVSLREALTDRFEITVLTKPLIEQAAQLFPDSGVKELLAAGREQELREYVKGRDLLDLVQDYRLKGASAQTLISILRKMPPRLYSIASSPSAYPDEVHLTVRKVAYESYGRIRYGVCSTQLSERLEIGGSLPVFVQENPNFKLPANPDTPVIMIGPGTGVAPFRAFLGEREETGAEGKTWLFYGDQHFATDFLYQIEWQRWLKDGVLTRMDVAFSRDTDRKVYVQHRMLEKSKELYQWLQNGAAVYVCGDEKKMAHDVHAALLSILRQEGGMSEDEAADYLTRLQQEKRYQRDVY
ncbi:assimilatory sulfite reductase (NADPH) flavoprotein subunit [Cohnella zeiphila]|uniref:assimilatory sulfite reductase (NADPH) n=1 Tax=Cohnella zeiphila TaxID=2761120 RepID=A0A7X0SNN6_9BACL|nr:assimilatory sulfite reductase (NADPH) flavoprotein subunit [Cohnella zeiphila]MBB6733234.1 assimilatory sulfite reductase (NADPH) flavoprotein subunit [Cohnella zeiphila]